MSKFVAPNPYSRPS